jgi:glycosyltransferase involved in cell wall biosynthesis
MEAVRSGTPVLASHIDGNVGMLGESYPGYFCARDATALASRIAELHHHRDQLELLGAQASTCAERFSPDREAAELLAVIYDAIRESGKAADKPSITTAQ